MRGILLVWILEIIIVFFGLGVHLCIRGEAIKVWSMLVVDLLMWLDLAFL